MYGGGGRMVGCKGLKQSYACNVEEEVGETQTVEISTARKSDWPGQIFTVPRFVFSNLENVGSVAGQGSTAARGMGSFLSSTRGGPAGAPPGRFFPGAAGAPAPAGAICF